MDTARCKAFLAAAETGSFSRAAEQLDYTPSGVSQLVSALEQELGFSLMIRSSRGVMLTDNGRRVLPVVRSFLREEERLRQVAADIGGLVVGRVSIATYPSIASHWLPGVLRVFEESYPDIEIRLMEGTRQELTRWLEEKRADLAFFSYMDPMPYDWIPLAEDRMMAVLPENHPLAKEEAYPLERCRHERFIMQELGRDAHVMELFKMEGITPDIRYTTVEYSSTLAMVREGLGMTVTNELITQTLQGGVVVIPLYPPRQITLGIALSSLKNAAPAVKRFVRLAAERLTRPETR